MRECMCKGLLQSALKTIKTGKLLHCSLFLMLQNYRKFHLVLYCIVWLLFFLLWLPKFLSLTYLESICFDSSALDSVLVCIKCC